MSSPGPKHYTVFLGAPPASSASSKLAYNWRIVSPEATDDLSSLSSPSRSQQHVFYPPATLAEASRRISVLYENIIFKDTSVGDLDSVGDEREDEYHSSTTRPRDDQTTMITWAPTPSGTGMRTEPSMYFRAEPSRVHTTAVETQETQSYEYSDASSIARFPDFQFNLHTLAPLSEFSSSKQRGKGSKKISTLLATLEVEGPDRLTLRKGVDSGKEIYVFKMVLGDENGSVCKLTAWREVAEIWGGVGEETGIKRGDIVYLENVLVAWEDETPLVLTASPYLKSRAEICYRTMPRASFPDDARLRPDLRLGYSDATVRRVASVVHWFEVLAGLVAE